MNFSNQEEEISITKMCHVTTSNMSIMDFEGLGREFYDDDSDKEFDSAIDPLWEGQQISTFTAWCNAHLRKVDLRIDSFERDFRNGLKLMKLLEIISNDTLPAPDKGIMRFHKIANVNKCLKFIEDKGVKLASIGAEEIVDGNVKMTLGMIWTIILRFTIQNILVEDSSAKEGLLLWCQRKTNGYRNVKVENFKNSFQNGLAFCALIHSHDKTLIDYDSLSPNQSSYNLKLSFAVAEKHLDVPQMLNIDDMVHNKDSDERSIMAYVSSYYHAIEKKDKMNSALNNICQIISNEMQENQNAIDCDVLTKNILKWVDIWIAEFQDCRQCNDQSYLDTKHNNFKNYKFAEKPEKTKDKIQLQFASIQQSSENLKDNNYLIVTSKWCELEKLENQYEEYLSEQKHRYDLIQNLLGKFEINFQVQRAWISSKIDVLISKDYETADLNDLKKMQRAQDTFISSVGSHKSRLDKLVNIADELRRLNYRDMEMIEKKLDVIVSPWETLNHLNNQRTEHINNFLKALVEIDDLQLEFAKRVMPLYNWIQEAIQDLNDIFTFHFIDEIKDLIKAQESFKSTVDEAIDELKYTKSIHDRICRIITNTGIQKIPLNPYTDIIMQDVQKAWVQLEKSIAERDKALQDALFKEISFKDCKDKLTKLSEKVYEDLFEVQKGLYDLISLNNGNSKKQSICEILREQLVKCAPELREVQIISQNFTEEDKPGNSKSQHTFEQLNAIYEILEYLLSKVSRSLIYKIPSHSFDASQSNKIEEYRDCFKHFDRQNSNQLDPNQFRACMLSLGYPLDESEENDKSFKDMMNVVDPANTGFITMNSFLEFMTRKNTAKGNIEQLVESFKILANYKSSINRNTILQELPEPIAEYCIKNMPIKISSNGDNECYLDYNSFSKKLCNKQSSHQTNGSE